MKREDEKLPFSKIERENIRVFSPLNLKVTHFSLDRARIAVKNYEMCNTFFNL
ncbi:hypothetical protein DU19_0184 [Chlamydia muridarum]|nr:hypothetical protein DU17_0184 [Chlamydia muridarum]KDU81156.1 hypothetical protein DU18_0185 [Chlamydia muridarum]KDU82555.1 hypothetical protein DU19_0184 [Chlamydia muridarum]KDU83108.1 hypothetical protein DU20_0184 [Chlamydia muridarum]KDU84625.1 hypothetical protein DU21_0184 [Chlamydia muridarum]